MKYRIDGVEYGIDVDVPVAWGEDVSLLAGDDDLTHAVPWHAAGYTVQPFLSPEENTALAARVTAMVANTLQAILGHACTGFRLDRYHEYCPDDVTHLEVVRRLRALSPVGNFPGDFRVVDRRVSAICGVDVSCCNSAREAAGYFFVRLVRPGVRTDNNPPHRDTWLGRLRHAINIYVPLAGSNPLSSLSLIPGSHLWKESEVRRTVAGAAVGAVSYTVPAAVEARQGLDMIRPPVNPGEVMVFSPYLVHGGALNLNADLTRCSLEMRFWRRGPVTAPR